jgi:hypothetical protein
MPFGLAVNTLVVWKLIPIQYHFGYETESPLSLDKHTPPFATRLNRKLAYPFAF